MNNNNLDQVSMRSSKRKRERFNLKSVNDTSFGMGEIQPLLVKEVIPNSKSVLSVGNIVRLAPMNAPTFGEIKLHHNMMFVGMSDLTDKFSAFLAKQPVAFGGGLVQVPTDLPQVSRGVLAAMTLVGSKCTAYFPAGGASEAANEQNIRKWFYNINSDWQSSSQSIAHAITNYNAPSGYTSVFPRLHGCAEADVFTSSDLWCENLGDKDPQGHWQTAFKNYSGTGINIGRVLGWAHSFWVPSANFSPYSFLCAGTPENQGWSAQALRESRFFNPVTMDLEDVTPDNADYIIHNDFYNGTSSSPAILCFRLSDFGKRLRKVLLACGYGIEFNDDTPVSLMRLFAIYKAWFDAFGITLYQSWETTNCAKLLQYYDSDYHFDWSSTMKNAEQNPPVLDDVLRRQIFVAFFADLADMWFTEEQDFITAHIRTAAVSPNDAVPGSLFWDAPNAASTSGFGVNVDASKIAQGEPAAPVGNVGGHAYINTILHSQLDSEVLKRLYKVTNRNTIAGRRIAELLKAQGLGEYMKRCRSNFIGHWSCEVDVFDVTATADSYNSAENRNSVLGEFVGKGVGNGKSKRFSYTAPEYGFILDLAAMCPESGWTNGEDLSVRDIHKLDFYNPEYDGLGYELNPKSIVSSDVVSASCVPATAATMSKQSFGFVPRYTRHKVARNVMNGDFSLRSTRASFLPYSLDKYVAVGDRVTKVVTKATDTSGQELLVLGKCLSPHRVPIASPMYRYLARYPWMGNLNRIFTNIGRDKLANVPFMYWGYEAADGESVQAWFTLKTDDNFIVQNVYLYDYYAPMLAIEDSFETKEDGNNGGTDMAIGKA